MRLLPLQLVLLLLVSGCLAKADASGPRLRDLKACSFTFPDGSTVPCKNQAEHLEPGAADLRPDWICIDKAARDTGFAQIHRRGVDEYALRFMGIHTPVRGLVELPRTNTLISFAHADRNGFLPLGTHSSPPDLRVRLFNASLATDTPLLKNAHLEIVWSVHDTKTWPLLRIHTTIATYHVQSHALFDGKPELVPSEHRGQDYAFKFNHGPLLNAAFNPPEGMPNTDCQL